MEELVYNDLLTEAKERFEKERREYGIEKIVAKLWEIANQQCRKDQLEEDLEDLLFHEVGIFPRSYH